MESGLVIRPAGFADAPRMLEMGLEQCKESGWMKRDPQAFDPHSFLEYLSQLEATGIMLVAEKDGRVGGMVGFGITTLNCNRNILLCKGIFWYVEPEFRKEAALPLLAALEKAASARGIRYSVVGVDDGERSAALSRLYRRAGYRSAEHVHIKEL